MPPTTTAAAVKRRSSKGKSAAVARPVRKRSGPRGSDSASAQGGQGVHDSHPMAANDSAMEVEGSKETSSPFPAMETFFLEQFPDILQGQSKADGVDSAVAAVKSLDDKWGALAPKARASYAQSEKGETLRVAPVKVPCTLGLEMAVSTDVDLNSEDPSRRSVIWWRAHEFSLKAERKALEARLASINSELEVASKGVREAVVVAVETSLGTDPAFGTEMKTIVAPMLKEAREAAADADSWCQRCCRCPRTREDYDDDDEYYDMYTYGYRYRRSPSPLDPAEIADGCSCVCQCSTSGWTPIHTYVLKLSSSLSEAWTLGAADRAKTWIKAVGKLGQLSLTLANWKEKYVQGLTRHWIHAMKDTFNIIAKSWQAAAVTVPASSDHLLLAWCCEAMKKLEKSIGLNLSFGPWVNAMKVSWSDPRVVAACAAHEDTPQPEYFEPTSIAAARLDALVKAGRLDHAINFSLATGRKLDFVKLCFEAGKFAILADHADVLVSTRLQTTDIDTLARIGSSETAIRWHGILEVVRVMNELETWISRSSLGNRGAYSSYQSANFAVERLFQFISEKNFEPAADENVWAEMSETASSTQSRDLFSKLVGGISTLANSNFGELMITILLCYKTAEWERLGNIQNCPHSAYLALVVPIIEGWVPSTEPRSDHFGRGAAIKSLLLRLVDTNGSDLPVANRQELVEKIMVKHMTKEQVADHISVASQALSRYPHSPVTRAVIQQFASHSFEAKLSPDRIDRFCNVVTFCAKSTDPSLGDCFQKLWKKAVDGHLQKNLRSKIMTQLSTVPEAVGHLKGLLKKVDGNHHMSPHYEPSMWLDIARHLRGTNAEFSAECVRKIFAPCEEKVRIKGEFTGGTPREPRLRWTWPKLSKQESFVSPSHRIHSRWQIRLRMRPTRTKPSGTVKWTLSLEAKSGPPEADSGKGYLYFNNAILTLFTKAVTNQPSKSSKFALIPYNQEGTWHPVHGMASTCSHPSYAELNTSVHKTVAFDAHPHVRPVQHTLLLDAIQVLSGLTQQKSAREFLVGVYSFVPDKTRRELAKLAADSDPKLSHSLSLMLMANHEVSIEVADVFDAALDAAQNLESDFTSDAITSTLDSMLAWLRVHMATLFSSLDFPTTKASYILNPGRFKNILSTLLSTSVTSFTGAITNLQYSRILDRIFSRCSKLREHNHVVQSFAKSVEEDRSAYILNMARKYVTDYKAAIRDFKKVCMPCHNAVAHRSVVQSCSKCANAFYTVGKYTADYFVRSRCLGVDAGIIKAAISEGVKQLLTRDSLMNFAIDDLFANANPKIAGLTFPEFAGIDQPVYVLPSEGDQCVADIQVPCDTIQMASWLWNVMVSSGVAEGSNSSQKIADIMREEEIDFDVLMAMSSNEIVELFGVAVANPADSVVPLTLIGTKVTSRVKACVLAELDQTFLCPDALKSVLEPLLVRKPRQAFWDLLHPDGLWMMELDDDDVSAFCTFGFLDAAPDRPDLDDVSLLRGYRNALQNSKGHGPLPAVYKSDDRRPSCRIVAVGTTGAGKSTLLNATLNEIEITPTNAMRACTATIVEMEYLSCPKPTERYTGTVEFVDHDQWSSEVERWLQLIQEDAGEADGENPEADAERAAAVEEAFERLKAVYGTAPDFLTASSEDLLAQCEATEKLGTCEQITAMTASELSRKCATYIDSANEVETGAMWPLVKRVTLRGPWGVLACGATLIDAPGLHDSNKARASVVRAEYRSADSLWLISNIKRAVNDKTIRDLLPLAFRDHLVRHGVCGQVIQISTQTDVCVRSEIISNLKLPDTTTMMDAVRARSEFSKNALTSAFYEGIERAVLPVNSVESKFALPCIAASAVDYQKLSGVRKGDGAARVFKTVSATEILALRRLVLDTVALFSDSHTRPTIGAGELLLRYEPKAEASMGDMPVCINCSEQLDITSNVKSCATCVNLKKWSCEICFRGKLTYSGAADCEASHPIEVVRPQVVTKDFLGFNLVQKKPVEPSPRKRSSVRASIAQESNLVGDSGAAGPAASSSTSQPKAILEDEERRERKRRPGKRKHRKIFRSEVDSLDRGVAGPAASSGRFDSTGQAGKSGKRKAIVDDAEFEAAVQASLNDLASKRRRTEPADEDVEVIDLTLDD